MKKTVIILSILSLLLMSFGALAMAAGCADCHSNIAEGLGGPHKSLGTTTDYEACLKCHKSGKMALGPILHKVHLVNNKDFDCKACHGVKDDGSIFLVK
ncbi:MAG: hypothetical protein H0Z38_05185 [Firmicutes bacterium]|nr:hypothetical protein [Bacillota bacterium]